MSHGAIDEEGEVRRLVRCKISRNYTTSNELLGESHGCARRALEVPDFPGGPRRCSFLGVAMKESLRK